MTPAAGVSFKAQHFAEATGARAAGLWFEVHAENYMVEGGPRLAMLEELRQHAELSLHGVGMSLGGFEPPDRDHLAAWKRLVDRFQPALVSEHLAWSRLDGCCYPDLLPVARTTEALWRTVANIGRVQDALGRPMLIENPSHYLDFGAHEWSETDFLIELCRRSGCQLLVDINNVVVGAHNLVYHAHVWLDAIPAELVGEIHLAGHSLDAEGELLIDSHDSPVCEQVWDLFDRFVTAVGPRPTLIERDADIPPMAELMNERSRAQRILSGEGHHARAA